MKTGSQSKAEERGHTGSALPQITHLGSHPETPTLSVGVCATLFCANVEQVLERIPANVCNFSEDVPGDASLTVCLLSAGPARHVGLKNHGSFAGCLLSHPY